MYKNREDLYYTFPSHCFSDRLFQYYVNNDCSNWAAQRYEEIFEQNCNSDVIYYKDLKASEINKFGKWLA